MNRKFSCAALFAALILSWSLVATTSAGAVEFQEEFDAAATKGAIELGKLTAFRNFLDAAGSTKLKNLAITNVKASQGALTGDVQFFNSQFSILVYGGGGAKSSFVAFEAKNPVKFSKIFGPKAELLNVLVPERQMFVLAIGDVEIEKDELPAGVQKIIDPFFTDDDYTLELDQGMTLLGISDLGKSKVLADAIKFLGGKATLVAFRVAVAGNVLDSLLEGKPPVPEIKLTALLPKFQPSIGNLIRLPADIQFELSATVSAKRDKAELGIKTGFEFKHDPGGKPVKMELEMKVSLEKGEKPEFEVSAGMPEDEKLEGAFGVKWLTLSDYKMTFKGKPGEPVAIEMSGSTSFGEKTLHLGGGIQVGATTAGFPVPEKLEFAIDDGPNKVGQLSIVDIVKAFEFIAKENGKSVRVNYKNIPDLAITGTKKGEGPGISISLRASKEFGFDITGILRFLGTNIATVERAFLSADSGFQLTAKTTKLGNVGPIQFPNVEIDVAFVASKEDRSAEEPRIILRTKNASLFGGTSELDLVVRPGQFSLVSKSAYGSLFSFDFAAYTGERITDLAGLAKADFIIDARLTSDIGKWIKDTGKNVVKESFDKFTSNKAVSKAVADLGRDIATLNTKIKNKKAQILKKRAKINEAKQKVGELNATINGLSSQIANFDRLSRRSCNQTKSVCDWFDILKWKCTKYVTVADIVARTVCVAENGAAWTKKVEKETERAAVVAAKVVAEGTLTAVEKGVALLPTDLDPEVAGYYVDRDAKMLLLATVNETLREFKKASAFLIAGTNFVGNVGSNNFKITNARIQGSLRAAISPKPEKRQPIVLTLDYLLHGKNHRDRIAYSVWDANYNKAQAEAWILGIALQAMTEFAHSQPLVPYAFLDGALKHFRTVQATAQAEVAKALANLHKAEREAKYASINDVVHGEQKVFNEHRGAAREDTLSKMMAELDKERKIRAGILVVDSGDLIYYRLKAGQFGGLPKKIGVGWNGFKTVFAGVGNRLYGIKPGGKLHYYTQNATGKFLSSKVIGSAWQKYKYVFSGPVGVIYAVTTDGHLYIYHHDAAGRFTAQKEPAGSGWNACKSFFTNGATLLYCVKNDNSLWIWPIQPNGKVGAGSKRGAGFGFKHIFSGGGGIIYGIDNRGVLLKYDHAWPFRWITTGKKIGGGWSDYAKVASNGSWVYAIKK